MCFSASASFGASAVLLFTAIKSIRQHKKFAHYGVALIPLIFALQQATEGMVWLTFDTHPYMAQLFSLLFIFFAFIAWPLWIPISLFIYAYHQWLRTGHKNAALRKLLFIITIAAGAFTAITLAYYLLQQSIFTRIECSRISYHIILPSILEKITQITYGIATLLPWFLVPTYISWITGFAFIGAYIASSFFYTHYVISVWCFFAALISILVLFFDSCGRK